MKPHEQQDIISQVRSGDYDRFLAIQLAPATARAGLYAVTAFHIELARIAQVVSEPLMGHIRLAWWREALEEIEAGKSPRNHPVVLGIAGLYSTYPDIFPWLHKAIAARAADMDTSLIAQESAWQAYCDDTAGALHMAWALLLGVDKAHHETIITQARAYAFVGLVRAIPFMHQQGWLRFPHSRMNAAGIISLEPSDGLLALSRAVVSDAVAMMEQAGNHALPKPLRGLSTLAMHHARHIARAGHNPYPLNSSKLAAVWHILKLTVA